MTTENKTTLAGMGAETSYQAVQETEPARPSGFIALGLGVFSAVAFLGVPLLIIPVLAIITGLLALRRCDGNAPLGTGPAKLGLILAVGFGACGIAVPWLKVTTLGGQAERFSRDYLRLVARGDDYLAMELEKRPLSRLPATMSLSDYYQSNPGGQGKLEFFRIKTVNERIRQYGVDADWRLDRPVRLDYHFGREKAEVVWLEPSGKKRVQFFMEYQVDKEGIGQWHIETVQNYRERIVAERVL